MPSLIPAGPVPVRVVTEGITGPEITVILADAAPALFSMAGGYAIATDAAGKLLTADAPAHAGDIVVIYLTGLGRTSPNPAMGEIPNYAASMVVSGLLKVTLNGTGVDPMLIKYAGLTPGRPGCIRLISRCRRRSETTRRSGSRQGIWRRRAGLNCRYVKGIAATFRAGDALNHIG